jgi:hypothetical protein
VGGEKEYIFVKERLSSSVVDLFDAEFGPLLDGPDHHICVQAFEPGIVGTAAVETMGAG